MEHEDDQKDEWAAIGFLRVAARCVPDGDEDEQPPQEDDS